MVLQRIQSVYLFLASVLMGLFSFLPTFNMETAVGKFKLSPFALESYNQIENSSMENAINAELISHTWIYFAICVVIAVLIFITIFLFKKLKRQKKFAVISLLLTICYCISFVVYSYLIMQQMTVTNWSFSVITVLPVLSILFIILAIHGINKDRKLLSDSFRIR